MATLDPDDENDDALDESRSASARDVGLVDIHCHLLPGVDDGCRTLAESLECARRLASAGFTHAFCTPHVWPDLPHNNAADVRLAVAQLQQEVEKSGIPLTLYPGGETRLGDHIVETPPENLVLLNLGQSRGGRFFLFDSWESQWPAYMEKAIRRLTRLGITPIMAHPERCAFFHEDPLDVADHLGDMGVLFQLNCYVLNDKAFTRKLYSKPMRHAAERLIEFDYYSFLATDLHRAETLDERLASLDSARSLMGSAMFRKLAKRNPIQILPE